MQASPRPSLLSTPVLVVALGVATVAPSAGCLDEGAYKQQAAETRRAIELEQDRTDAARAEGRRLTEERDTLAAQVKRLDSDLASIRARLRAIPADPSGGGVPAAALRRLDDLEARSQRIKATTPPSEADAAASAAKQAELDAIRREVEQLRGDVDDLAKLAG